MNYGESLYRIYKKLYTKRGGKQILKNSFVIYLGGSDELGQ